jgi:hypothetical protein
MAKKKIWEFPENNNPQSNLVFLVDENYTTQKLSLSGLTNYLTNTIVSPSTYVTGFTYNKQNKLTLSQNQGQQDIIVYLNEFSGVTVNGSLSATTVNTDNLKLTSGANDGYLLTSDVSGNATWQEPHDIVKLGTGLTIHFSGRTIFNLPDSPASGNISGNTTNAKFGMVQKIYHQSSVEPTFPTTWKLVGEGVYFTNILNMIYVEYITNNRIEYWVIQDQ